ncbi:MAG TPA: hypothetical protein VE934_07810 [Polaromonas sp.]|uniref:hypothetical protein n=1 Tax=Polaromonas sp. TaxID=1869339 RepID=UPI002D303D13|nr:hypothetical protein [Polaromonas sp.]HYW56850.1 hypothetical protein [Polaromonas sp.]
MISTENPPLNSESSDTDFTVTHYRELLKLAKQNFVFATYDDIPWGSRFVLWRHDCDYSLNRAHGLATVEAAEGVRATYFLNPHCEFYNLFERSQHRLVREILGMGHKIGLHFDGAFHDVVDEDSLSAHVQREAALLEGLYGVKPLAFSFHNPAASHLACDAEAYGGLTNCYSGRLKAEVPYCSDSNGYWRFRRLRDVLTEATDPCLQVLTHPGWWQDKVSPPRQRIFRSVYGRAKATLQLYDEGLDAHGRENFSGASAALAFMRPLNLQQYQFCDMLWISAQLEALFDELWRLHQRQINKLCKAIMRTQWQVPAAQINTFFEDPCLSLEGWELFSAVFEDSWQEVSGIAAGTHQEWIAVRKQLVSGRAPVEYARLESGCVYLCQIISSLAAWGKTSTLGYDGVADLRTVGLSTCEEANGDLPNQADTINANVDADASAFSQRKWAQFKQNLAAFCTSEKKP